MSSSIEGKFDIPIEMINVAQMNNDITFILNQLCISIFLLSLYHITFFSSLCRFDKYEVLTGKTL